jgi:hypothetical protein
MDEHGPLCSMTQVDLPIAKGEQTMTLPDGTHPIIMAM